MPAPQHQAQCWQDRGGCQCQPSNASAGRSVSSHQPSPAEDPLSCAVWGEQAGLAGRAALSQGSRSLATCGAEGMEHVVAEGFVVTYCLSCKADLVLLLKKWLWLMLGDMQPPQSSPALPPGDPRSRSKCPDCAVGNGPCPFQPPPFPGPMAGVGFLLSATDFNFLRGLSLFLDSQLFLPLLSRRWALGSGSRLSPGLLPTASWAERPAGSCQEDSGFLAGGVGGAARLCSSSSDLQGQLTPFPRRCC